MTDNDTLPGQSVADEVAPGTRVGPLAFSGDYIELGRKIGEGATAHVYECSRLRPPDNTPLAVKVIDTRRLHMLDDAEKVLGRLEMEVRALREAQHERCLGLHDIFRDRRHVFLVMERVPGGELFDQISRKKHFNEVEARYVFRQVCEGIAFLHSKHIVHRDIKPENILVSGEREATAPESGTLFDVKLADYGLSKFLTDGAIAHSMVGTPQYWAPEVAGVASGHGAYDERADLWSLGVFLYVILRGKYPVKGGNYGGELDLSSGVWSQVSAEAKDLLRNLLQVKPDERIPLQAVLKHPWVTGRPAEPQMTPSPSSEPSALGPVVQSVSSGATQKTGGYGGRPILPIAPAQGVAAGRPDGAGDVMAVVRWEHRGHLYVGGDGRGTAFDLVELCRLQMSLATLLEFAALACLRAGHPHLAADIRSALAAAEDLGMRALKVIREYGLTAQAVKDKILPDLQLAVEAGVPNMAVECLDIVTKWSQTLRKDSEETQEQCIEFSRQLHGLVTKAMLEQQGHATSGGPPALLDVDMTDAPGATGGFSAVNRKTREKFDGLERWCQRTCAADAADASELCEEGGLIDLLFLAPGVQREASEGGGSASGPSSLDKAPSAATALSGKDAASLGDAAATEAPAAELVPVAAVARGNDFTHPLVHAMQDLRRVGAILRECMAFWTNMDGTVQELSRLKDHMGTLVRYASNNGKIKERFDQRLSEYKSFWESLMRLCQQYCVEVEPALSKARKAVISLEGLADRIDAGT